MKRLAAAAAVVAAALATGRAQEPARVDFVRDVQPIFRQHCYSCHGPTTHQAGLRLDRRADAMRGGTIAVIGPGTSEASRLYLRVKGERGSRMPPTAPLTDAQIATIKSWIDQGALWPDEAAGDAPPRPTPPLMRAVLDDDLAAMRRLLEAGTDPNARNGSGATALMWAAGDQAKTQLLLERGADPNLASDDSRTALMIASSQHGNAAVVKLLLDRGANPNAEANGATPLVDAAYTGDEASLRLLIDAGAKLEKLGGIAVALAVQQNCMACAELVASKLTQKQLESGAFILLPPGSDGGRLSFLTSRGVEAGAIEQVRRKTEDDLLKGAGSDRTPPPPSPAASARAAVARSLPLLQQTDASFMRKAGCVSCHHNSLTAMVVAAARSHGIAVNESIARSQTTAVARYLESWRERALVGLGIPGDHDTISYLLLGLAAEAHPRDDATDAMVRFLRRVQDANGQWHIIAHRPPIESSDIEVTAASMRALQQYAPPESAANGAAIARASEWLVKAEAKTTEDRAFRLLGLHWSGAAPAAIDAAARELAAAQRADGGWSQLASLDSDAYATGQALAALGESGSGAIADSVRSRAVQFLLRSQLADGSWFVKSRALPIQPYFESGFPHGRSQFISAAATAWAAYALALAER